MHLLLVLPIRVLQRRLIERKRRLEVEEGKVGGRGRWRGEERVAGGAEGDEGGWERGGTAWTELGGCGGGAAGRSGVERAREEEGGGTGEGAPDGEGTGGCRWGEEGVL